LPDDDLQLFDVEGLGDVIEGPRLQRLDRRLGGSMGGDHDDCHGWVLPLDLAKKLEPRTVRKHEIAENQIGFVFLQRSPGLGERGGCFYAATIFFKDGAEKIAQRYLVID